MYLDVQRLIIIFHIIRSHILVKISLYSDEVWNRSSCQKKKISGERKYVQTMINERTFDDTITKLIV